MTKKEPEQLPTDDAILLMLLSLVEEDEVEVPVTLNVNGAIVSGILVGPSVYYKGITEASKDISDSTLSKILAKKFNDLKEAYLKQKQEQEDSESEGDNVVTYIHLINARYNGTSSHTDSGSWWRGEISSIDGYSFDFLV